MMRRLVHTLLLFALGSAVAAGAAYAAGLGVVSGRLTVVSVASTVPVSTCTLGASADAYVDQTALLLNFGGETSLSVRSGVLANQRIFVGFNIASCGIPAGARIRSAGLELNATTVSGRTYGVHQATASWSESSLTWANQPGAGAATATAVVAAPGVVSWNVQADVAAVVAGSVGNDGWIVIDGAESAIPPSGAVFGSRESAAGPSLRITYYP
jgi:hypothetical protein